MSYTFGDVTNCKVANGQTRSEYQCRLGYEVNSQSIENNTSSVTLLLQARSINSSYKTKGNGQTPTIDGMTLSKRTIDMSNTNEWQDLGSRTITISHNADGSCSVNKTGSFVCTAGSSNYSLRSGSASVTVTPNTIPRASQPSCITFPNTTQNVGDIGSKFTIHMNRVSDSFTHTVRYTWANKSGTIATGVTNNVEWTIPMDFCDNIGSAVSGTGTIYVDTYSGSNYIGTKSVNFTANVPNSVVPSINSVAISEANSGVGLDVYVQNKSQLRVITNASGSYSSWITSCKITGIDNNVYWGTDITSGILIGSGTKTITITVTDSRGRTASTTRTYNCIAYSNPQIISFGASRCNADGTENDNGESIKYSFKGSISSINNKNSKVYKIGYKHSTDNDYTYITIDNDDYSIDKSDVVISDIVFSNNNSYDIQFLIQDKYITVVQNVPIGTGKVLMNFNSNGKAMAIGKKSEREEDFELGMQSFMSKSSGDTMYCAKRTDTGNEVKFGIGSSGVSRGIWDMSLNKWLFYTDGVKNHINGSLDISEGDFDVRTGNITARGNVSSSEGLLQAKPIVAYENVSGTNGTVTLSANVEDYKHIRITYKNDDGQYNATTVTGVNYAAGDFFGTIIRKSSNNDSIMINSAIFGVYGSTISISRNSQANIFFGGSSSNDSNQIYITKVELWN